MFDYGETALMRKLRETYEKQTSIIQLLGSRRDAVPRQVMTMRVNFDQSVTDLMTCMIEAQQRIMAFLQCSPLPPSPSLMKEITGIASLLDRCNTLAGAVKLVQFSRAMARCH